MIPCVYCEHPPHAGECDVVDEDGERCECPTYSDVPPPPLSVDDLTRRLDRRVALLKNLIRLNAPATIIDKQRDMVAQTKAELHARRNPS